MPKIIENLETRLIEEAKLQMDRSGYSVMTMRSIAKACGVGVGTVYNYFPSKDALIASYMLRDWKDSMKAVTAVSDTADTPEGVIRCMYDQLLLFADKHRTLFLDKAAAASFAGSFSHYHSLLRTQIAEPIRKFCQSDFAAEFIAESLLVWTMAGKDFQDIYGMINKLF